MTAIDCNLPDRMEGVSVALATPLTDEWSLDIPALERLVERVIKFGTCCVFPLGWCGEQPMLSGEVRAAMLRETVRIVKGRVPVLAGITEQSLARVLDEADVALEAGADMILTTPPYSYPVPQDFVFEFFRELAGAATLPIVAYQNDDVSVRIEVDTMARLSEIPGIIGVKAYMPFAELQAAYYLADQPGRFAIMSGDERLFGPALFTGIRHFTMGTPGNICMQWCAAIHQYAVENDWDAVRDKHRELTAFCDAICGIPAPFMAVKKYVMSRLGICGESVSAPVRRLSNEEKTLADAVIEEHKHVLDPAEN